MWQLTLRPSCAALIAATYPATPPPITTRSFSSDDVAYPRRTMAGVNIDGKLGMRLACGSVGAVPKTSSAVQCSAVMTG